MGKYNFFIFIAWVGFVLSFALQSLDLGSLSGVVIACISIILILYLSTYISIRLFLRAIQRKKIAFFILEVTIISSITSLLILLDKQFLVYLGEIGILSVQEIFSEQATVTISNWINMFFTSFFMNLGFCGMRFYKENMDLSKTLEESQLHILQAQINPHFMFNVLNHIHILMHKDVDLASDLLLKYSDILRYQLYSGKREYITTAEEVQFLQNFIDIEKTRWKNKLDVVCTWNIKDNSFEFPPLLLITFIENAFKHVSRSDFEKGYVHIDFTQTKKTIQLNVENSKSQIKSTKNNDSGLGLENIKKRLDILYPAKYKLTITDTDLVYYTELIINV